MNLRHLTPRSISCTKWRLYRDHRLCDVTSPCVFASWSLIPIPIGIPIPIWSSLFHTAGPRKINNVWSMSAFIVMAMDAFMIQSMQTCDCASISRSHSSSKVSYHRRNIYTDMRYRSRVSSAYGAGSMAKLQQ